MAKKTQGRPPIDPSAGMRIPVAFRATPKIRNLLEEASEKSGRSMSQEIEIRLERSFEREHLLPQVLSLAYDRETAGILMAIGTIMSQSGTFAMVRRLGALRHRDVPPWEMQDLLSSIDWKRDPHAVDTALRAAIDFLTRLRPRPHASDADLPGAFSKWMAQLHAYELAKILKDKADPEGFNFQHVDLVRTLLGDFVSRLDSEPAAGWSERETKKQGDVPAEMTKGVTKSDGDSKKTRAPKR